jgi:hypothetical protein
MPNNNSLIEILKKFPLIRWSIFIIVIIISTLFIISGIGFLVAWKNGSHVKFLSFEVNIPIDSDRPLKNELKLDTSRPQLSQLPSSIRDSKRAVTSAQNANAKYDMKGSAFNAPAQIGDNNIQNNVNIDPELSREQLQNAVDSIGILLNDNNITNKEVMVVQIAGSNSSKILRPFKQVLIENGYLPTITITQPPIRLSKGFTFQVDRAFNNVDKMIAVYLNTF